MDTKSQNTTLPEGFVYVQDEIPNIIPNLRYATNENFVGRPINGYTKDTKIVLTKESCDALKKINEILNADGYILVIYDTYRPQRAVDDFYQWAQDAKDDKMRDQYYPNFDKPVIFEKGYLQKKSGHTRGSTVDVGLLKKGNKLKDIEIIKRKFNDGTEYNYLDDGTEDFGTSWDFIDISSNYINDSMSEEVNKKRAYLRKIFEDNGFVITPREWWHFKFEKEPFPETYFDFIA